MLFPSRYLAAGREWGEQQWEVASRESLRRGIKAALRLSFYARAEWKSTRSLRTGMRSSP